MTVPPSSEFPTGDDNPFRAPTEASHAPAEPAVLHPERVAAAKRAIRMYRGMRTGLALLLSLFALILGGIVPAFLMQGEAMIIAAVVMGMVATLFLILAIFVWIRAVWVAWSTTVIAGLMTLSSAIQGNVAGGTLPFLMLALSIGVLYFASCVKAEGLPLSARIRRGGIVV